MPTVIEIHAILLACGKGKQFSKTYNPNSFARSLRRHGKVRRKRTNTVEVETVLRWAEQKARQKTDSTGIKEAAQDLSRYLKSTQEIDRDMVDGFVIVARSV